MAASFVLLMNCGLHVLSVLDEMPHPGEAVVIRAAALDPYHYEILCQSTRMVDEDHIRVFGRISYRLYAFGLHPCSAFVK